MDDTSVQLFHRYNPWWSGKFRLQGIVDRERLLGVLRKACDSRDIVIITGLRRIGKTTLMRQLVKHLVSEKRIAPKHVFYITMDDYSLKGRTLASIVDDYRAIHKIRVDEEVFLFLDEVTAMPDYEIQLKNLYDLGGVKIFASSSSASVLRSGKAHITGRHKVVEVPPLDFEEYLKFRRIVISPLDAHLRKAYFEDFLKTGGIPEFVLSGDASYLHQLVDDIICKDIAAFHGIKNVALLKDFFLLLMERAGKSVSVNKLARILDISPDTAKRHLAMFEETYLVHLVQRHGKLNEQLRSPKKLYAADLGIRVMFTGYRDVGSLFENYVFLKIAERKPRFVLEDGIEIDFLTEDRHLLEVKYYSRMTEKQKRLFDAFKAKARDVIGSVEDLSILDDEDESRRLSDAPSGLAEERAPYGAEIDTVNLGRGPRMEVLEPLASFH